MVLIVYTKDFFFFSKSTTPSTERVIKETCKWLENFRCLRSKREETYKGFHLRLPKICSRNFLGHLNFRHSWPSVNCLRWYVDLCACKT